MEASALFVTAIAMPAPEDHARMLEAAQAGDRAAFEQLMRRHERMVLGTAWRLLGNVDLIAGPSGTGKSVLAAHFIAAGIRQGEPGIVAVFEDRPEEYTARADSFGLDLRASLAAGQLKVIYLRPLDLSVDETMQEILDAIKRIGARRLVIDSLAGFELALAPAFRTDFRESLYRMIFSLTGIGVTILSTLELEESFHELAFSSHSISFLTDDIVLLRYIEIECQLRKILTIVKMRGGAHSKDIREYDITPNGIAIGERLTDYYQVITGLPKRLSGSKEL